MLAVSTPRAATLRSATSHRAASGAVRREVQARGIARSVVAQVALPVRPARAPPRPQEHDRAFRNAAVPRLPGRELGDGEAVIGIGRRRRRHVDHDRRANETRERHLVRGGAALREMDGRVEVGAAVLGRAEAVRGIEEAGLRLAVMEPLELEAVGRRRASRASARRRRCVRSTTRAVRRSGAGARDGAGAATAEPGVGAAATIAPMSRGRTRLMRASSVRRGRTSR